MILARIASGNADGRPRSRAISIGIATPLRVASAPRIKNFAYGILKMRRLTLEKYRYVEVFR
jgi:hypothetical protein